MVAGHENLSQFGIPIENLPAFSMSFVFGKAASDLSVAVMRAQFTDFTRLLRKLTE